MSASAPMEWRPVCPKCAGDKIDRHWYVAGKTRTLTSAYCTDCGWAYRPDNDIVARIRWRFPNPKDADDGLLSNEAADEIVRLRARVEELENTDWAALMETGPR